MAFKPSSVATDLKAEVEGVWVPYQAGSKILVGRYTNDKASKLRRSLTQKHLLTLQAGGDIAEKLMEELELKVLSECVLLGWQGFENDDDSEMEYSTEKALELLTLYRDFRDDVTGFAQDRDRFKVETLKADTDSLKA